MKKFLAVALAIIGFVVLTPSPAQAGVHFGFFFGPPVVYYPGPYYGYGYGYGPYYPYYGYYGYSRSYYWRRGYYNRYYGHRYYGRGYYGHGYYRH